MSRLVPACPRCNGPLTEPLPADVLDPRLSADSLIKTCADCGRAARVDLVSSWRNVEDPDPAQ